MRRILIVITMLSTLLCFQNCGSSFEPTSSSGSGSGDSSSSSSSSSSIPNSSSTETTNTAPMKTISAQYPGDLGIDKDKRVIFASNFENDFLDWDQNIMGMTIGSDVKIGNSKYAIAKVVVPNELMTPIKHSDGRTIAPIFLDSSKDKAIYKPEYKFDKTIQTQKTFAGEEKIYFRFYFKMEKKATYPHHSSKIYAVSPSVTKFADATKAGIAPDGDKAFWTGLELSHEDKKLHFYTYYHDMKSYICADGTTDCDPSFTGSKYYGNGFNPSNQDEILKDKWYCVEFMLKANTVGKQDGEQAFWVNDKLVGEYKTGAPLGNWNGSKFYDSGKYSEPKIPFEGYDFRTDNAVKINKVILRWYISDRSYKWNKQYLNEIGTGTDTVYFDDVVVAREHIGCKQ